METTTHDGTEDLSEREGALLDVARSANVLPEDRWVDTTAMLLVDAIVDADLPPLRRFLDEASRIAQESAVHRQSVEALSAVAQWGIARTLPVAIGRSIDLKSATGRILVTVSEQPGCSSKDLYMSLDIAEETVSRIGNQLEADGLVMRTRAGKWRRWRLTRMGENVLQAAHLNEVAAPESRSLSEVSTVLRKYQAEAAQTSTLSSQRPKPVLSGTDPEFLRRLAARKKAREPGKPD